MNLEIINLKGRVYLADQDSFIDIDTIYDDLWGYGARIRATNDFSYWIIIKEDLYASFLFFKNKDYYKEWRKKNPEYRIFVSCDNFTNLVTACTQEGKV